MTSKNILIAGASGFIGRKLVTHLEEKGHKVYKLGRQKAGVPTSSTTRSSFTWSQLEAGLIDDINLDVIINLAGASVGEGRWTRKRKAELAESRISSTQALSQFTERRKDKPALFIQTSAIGFYGYKFDYADEDSPRGDGFLAELTEEWESALRISADIRQVIMRLGIVIGDGGVMKKMAVSAPFGFVVLPGGGHQYLSIIKIEDVLQFVEKCIDGPDCRGIINLVDSRPITLKELLKPLAPIQIPLPAFLFTAILGQMAQETILADQKTIRKRSEIRNKK
jgi:uncharacterized protein (TIGR01777 family)